MKTAIIVDDEELSVELLKNIIRWYDLPIDVVGQADNGEKAIELVNDLKPSIVFLDIEMPVLNGIEVMKRIKASCPQGIDIIVITAYDYFEYAQSSLRLGAKDILLKPIDAKQFVEILEKVIGYRHTDNEGLNKILEYINNNYQDDIKLNGCAEIFHINPNQIARMFKKYLGVSFINYLNKVRITKAKYLLLNTDFPIKQIADMVGYNNINYFYKRFKSDLGLTPKEFRKRGGQIVVSD